MVPIIERFYEAFSRLDSESMVQCYHDDIVFEDPVFGKLKGEKAKNMWRMLCQSQKNKDFKIEYSQINYSNQSGSAYWEAFYIFSRTGRKVHNKINAQFIIKDDKIVHHVDNFSLHQWASQALGLKGKLLGNTSFFKRKMTKQVNILLTAFEAKNQLK